MEKKKGRPSGLKDTVTKTFSIEKELNDKLRKIFKDGNKQSGVNVSQLINSSLKDIISKFDKESNKKFHFYFDCNFAIDDKRIEDINKFLNEETYKTFGIKKFEVKKNQEKMYVIGIGEIYCLNEEIAKIRINEFKFLFEVFLLEKRKKDFEMLKKSMGYIFSKEDSFIYTNKEDLEKEIKVTH